VSTQDSSDQNSSSSADEEFAVSLPSGKSITAVRPVSREATAAALGQIIVWTFSLSVASCFIVVFIEVFRFASQDQITLGASLELFKTVSAVLSGPLGFVLGFYFRDGTKD
jgi:hypothetical protein